jgi:hypothetical protein
VVWYYIGKSQKLSEEFMIQFKDRLNWENIAKNLYEEFLTKHNLN